MEQVFRSGSSLPRNLPRRTLCGSEVSAVAKPAAGSVAEVAAELQPRNSIGLSAIPSKEAQAGSADGTMVPLSILYRKERDADSRADFTRALEEVRADSVALEQYRISTGAGVSGDATIPSGP
jgi:hypothetical protein